MSRGSHYRELGQTFLSSYRKGKGGLAAPIIKDYCLPGTLTPSSFIPSMPRRAAISFCSFCSSAVGARLPLEPCLRRGGSECILGDD